ncbi:ORF_127R [Scale drop disease virus]|uniref:ORF_127R n=1 Tax=Scale drop disease virus TaxID=1697349 RepID=A0A0K1L6D8_9VIRU|nr:ORF_127R [Scale drop disease virus]AKU37542.1 ORF_127R [Scale drop disease virus]UNH60792.1 hypothetical protein SDDV_ORF123 [Scale drop disease virus]
MQLQFKKMALLQIVLNDDLNQFRESLTVDTVIDNPRELAYTILVYTSSPGSYFYHWDNILNVDLDNIMNSVSMTDGLILTQMVNNNISVDRITEAVYLGCNPFYITYGNIAPIFDIYNAGYATAVLKAIPSQVTIAFDISNCKIHQTGQTLLHYAGSKGDLDLVRFLITTYDIDKDMEYSNSDTMRFETVVDEIIRSEAENVLPFLFDDLDFDVNRLYSGSNNMTYFTRVCESKRDIDWLMDNKMIDLRKPNWPGCLMAAKANRVETATKLAVEYKDDVFVADEYDLTALHYMLLNFHSSYYRVLDVLNVEDVNSYYADIAKSHLAIHCVAEYCDVDVMKYVVDKQWNKPQDLLRVAVNVLTSDDERNYSRAIDMITYLVDELKYDPKPSNVLPPLYTIVAVFLHFAHRAVPAYMPLPQITYDGNDDAIMLEYFEKHDTLPNPDNRQDVATANSQRIHFALQNAYALLPVGYKLRPFDIRQTLSAQEYNSYIFNEAITIKQKLAQLIDICLMYCSAPELQRFFHPESKMYSLFDRVPTLYRLVKQQTKI